ncbi:hypothetical protein [uncultured Nitrospira sp.]|uniref:hypothetical protein n=1 Tax=uncultured Nitrospira sp. TaxID=157176 RepID=UPI003140C841
MRSSPKRFALFLIGLFLAFSFNAYACVVPIYADLPTHQVSDCTMPGKGPVSQFCDGFQSFLIQSGADLSSAGLSNVMLVESSSSLFLDSRLTGKFAPIPARGLLAPSKNILVLISVFRI